MAVLSVRVPDDLAERFDSAAAKTGGRSALLHRLVREAAAKAPRGAPTAFPARDAMRLMVRLASADAAYVAAEAAAMALPRAAWVAALVRRHAAGAPRFSRPGELALIATHGEVRRIGVNVNQIARALNTAVLEGRVLDTELSSLDDLRRELRDHMEGLGEAFRGNLAYWAAWS
ncbi:MAG: MobC family plasmid mobilization relaxosome protein [Alphaproteobacteria bacterium]|nr:MobC family plasmid mobilization relaxosome protein [Alphaproteobacteria bacterium]MBU1516556.1 MobC family plasmid mobilization relaxosome protein [Alphaproteobacteria bacterium]MBU2094313.1 MobC family plasmid mobilization relaxosome protein [Alphaproteobacteria bacterium]MBU2154110.1 MobC family plasmid mobilization relaxosome protein [Alphaproteobacteria bacterium]MBU2307483.1 MobC family plasmid mobilization relaxosome protein [Alphaproteobacteria bacterium]